MKQSTLIGIKLASAEIVGAWKRNNEKARAQAEARKTGATFISNYYETDFKSFVRQWIDSPSPLFDIAARILLLESESE